MGTHNICFHGEIRKMLCGYLGPLISGVMRMVWNYGACMNIYNKYINKIMSMIMLDENMVGKWTGEVYSTITD